MSGADALITSIALQGLGAVMACPLDLAKTRFQYATFFERPAIPELKHYTMSFGWRRGMFQSAGYYLGTPLVFSFVFDMRKHDGALLAALQARFVTTLAFSPLEYQRTLHQATGLRGFDFLHCLLPLRRRGARGLVATMGRDLSFTWIYCGGLLLAKQSKLIAATDELTRTSNDSRGTLSALFGNIAMPFTDPASYFVSFFFATAATIVSHPFDVLKTHMQTFPRARMENGTLRVQESTLRQTWKHITSAIGPMGRRVTDYSLFATGLQFRLLRIVPLFTFLGSQYFEQGWVSDEDPDKAFIKLWARITGKPGLDKGDIVDNRKMKRNVPMHPRERKTNHDL
ncbi:unnamed protein product [Amoebophrya sp. A25]|nr:unnamed protein product [Amoebophrya sp. A25]|eukprot:GSA25T00003528001.1